MMLKLLVLLLATKMVVGKSVSEEEEKSMIGVASDEEEKVTRMLSRIDASPADDHEDLQKRLVKTIEELIESEEVNEVRRAEKKSKLKTASSAEGESAYDVLRRYLQSSLSLEKKTTVCGEDPLISRSQQRRTVEYHNYFRAIESAANMKKFKWRDSLARRAQQWANECKWKHGMLTDCDGNSVGQNLYMVSKGSEYPVVDMDTPIEMWYAEKPNYHYDTRECDLGKMCGHYKQMVRATSTHLGCGIARCPSVSEGVTGSPWLNAVIVACDYRIILDDGTENIYRKGEPCSQCGHVVKVGYKCDNNLCVSCNPLKVDNCTCVERTCENGGTFNHELCQCECQPEFYGSLCEYPCKCEDNPQYPCASWTSYCTQETFHSLMQDYCPITCSLCRIPPEGACTMTRK